jgi:adenosine kinase
VNIVVTGSIANDYLMVFPGKFREQFVDGQLDKVSLSFLVDELEIRRGGIAANIAFGLGCLGLRPVLVGGVGPDFDEYRTWLKDHNVDTDSVWVSETKHTARFLCTTDADHNQIASFYAGAMDEARNVHLHQVAERVGRLDLVVIAPHDPVAMVQHTRECRERGYRFVADPSQQIARMDGPELRELVEGAAYLFSNAYERTLLERKTGWTGEEVLAKVGVSVTTHGADGVVIQRQGEPPVTVPVVPPRRAADPTGVGDGFRVGFLTGIAWDVGEERAAQVGCMVATLVLETVGPQEYRIDREEFLQRFGAAYGDTAAAEVAALLPKS